MSKEKVHGRVIAGLVLILLGLFFFLRNYDLYLIPEEFITWEYFFIVIGLLFFFLSRNKTAGVIFIAIGLFNLFPELWPLILVLFGLYIAFGSRGFKFNKHVSTKIGVNESEADFINETNIFGGGNKVYFFDKFRGGSVLSIFGGSEINLHSCKLAEGENVLDVTSIFGGSTIIVPADWKIEVDVLPIFGGFGDKRRKDPNLVYDESRKLIIKGVAIFGGSEIKNIM